MEKINFDSYDYQRSMLFCWPPWTGKTYKAKELLKRYKNESLHEDLITYTVNDAEFKQFVKSNMMIMRKHEDYATPITMYPLEMMLRCWILLYDDIGVSDVSDAYIRDLTFVIDSRMNKAMPTIYTTNLTKKELQEKLDERIVSRMLFNTDVVAFSWEDKRLATTNYFTA